MQSQLLRQLYDLPCMAVGDWNMTDVELRNSRWIDELMLDAVIIAPNDVPRKTKLMGNLTSLLPPDLYKA